MYNPKISVIVATYNNGDTIIQNINTVLKQTYENIEVVLINDGSTDNTSISLLKNFQNNNKVIIVNQTNKGLGAARNKGMSLATGDYILFMDGDDFLLKDSAIETLVKLIQVESLDWVVFGFAYVYKEKKMLPKNVGLDYINMYSAVWNKMYKTELIKELSFPESLRFEDMAFTIEAYLNSQHKGILNEPLYGYFQRSDSITKKIKNGRERFDALYVLEQAMKIKSEDNEKILKKYINYHYITHLILSIQESNFTDEELINQFIIFHKLNGLSLRFYNKKIKNILLIIYFILVKLRIRQISLWITYLIVGKRGQWRNE